ncbi:hypothetical protein COY59_05685 [Candidatus Gottesmanbacteria bacterium CG_4_10_14_0_8_um_filter_37_24]|uniref:Glycosyltransferase 2-like domain-containing protein n=1 Tax=Candidatus Gottesmanbacteria bacterium CG_4_10_14_0_8_um_filter_37_24 TaxID=1974574 RepID=A0A2M7RQP0_9BACT|nr:MAG: hypothetical protein COX23_06240 [Candidatus Gottesmanbacteria bacterium CG23_combo_of_CG06-09_8_20_14_all_37_19]PIZ02274.1 MAG: hypothetical protein COY59_05685 [Candidatus Gottesmanbacteria bacterium CG_4_10_14_0_8_um_filter_37_24]
MNNISIIIVTFNPGSQIRRLVNNLLKIKIVDRNIEIIIVDNASNDNSLGQIDKTKKVQIVRNDINLGFSKAVNLGIKFALKKNAGTIILVNQDVDFTNDFISPLLFNNNDIVSPVIKFKRNNQWVYDYGGLINFRIGRIHHRELDYPATISKGRIDYVGGCCMLIKSKVIENIGLFDERFFMYFEDADYCVRARKSGYNIDVESKSIVVHNFQEGKYREIKKYRYLIASNIIFINKYLGYKIPLGYLYIVVLSMKIIINLILK